LGSGTAADITDLVIQGSAFVTFADCRAIAAAFPTAGLKMLDLSAAKFENDSTPGNVPGETLGAFNSSDNGLQVTEVKLPADLRVIGPRTFRKFGKLKTINLPATLTRLGEGCFTACGSINIEEFPANLKTIDGYAFFQAYEMKSLEELPEGLVGKIGDHAFRQTSVAVTVIPVGVTEIGAAAFRAEARPVSLDALVLYQNVAKIGSQAFGNQAKLTNVEVNRMTPPETAANAFDAVNLAGIDLYIPIGSLEAYQAVEPWKSMGQIYAVLPEPTSGISEMKVANFSVYPNPAINTISITMNDDITVKSAKILNMAGAVVENLQVNTSLTFDVSRLSNGMYFLQLNNDTAVRFIKK